ncbi:hypothetical protein CFAM422_004420 [Trichoderma lentiforme]|uniref:Uncharacterized protein n=1 Tax=Trichoderma lentiforme TaxID=1567552 RepID=A0A9P5CGR0_9HYPO|nr:hypothetical protein CFAM422_004420 [Trichoderma lentiforme]
MGELSLANHDPNVAGRQAEAHHQNPRRRRSTSGKAQSSLLLMSDFRELERGQGNDIKAVEFGHGARLPGRRATPGFSA